MTVLKEIYNFIWQQNIENFSHQNLFLIINAFLFIVIFLENGILPAAFLPGDSLLILIGVLTSKGKLNFPLIVITLTIAASLGSWISYLQGKWLGNHKIIKNWVNNLPMHYQKRAYHMFYRHGLHSLLISRFITFIRTLLPIIVGLSGLSNSRFYIFNLISAFLWVFILITLGFFLGKSPFFLFYEEKLMTCLISLSLVFFAFTLISFIVFLYKKNK